MTGIRELVSTMSAAPEHIRVSVVGGRTQLDVALPIDVPVASLLPELVKLVRSRDDEAPTDTPWPATRHTLWTVRRLDPVTTLQPNETLRTAGVLDGELLQLTEQRALTAPTLYDDVVDAAARLNKAAYAGWNAAAAQWMSFAGIGVAALVWAYLLVLGPRNTTIVALAAVVLAAMIGFAALAHRSYGQAQIAAAVGWSIIPIGAAIVWELVRGFGDYGVAAGCAVMVVGNATCYWVIGTGRWGYLAGGLFFACAALAMLSHAAGMLTQTVGTLLAVAATFACLTVSRATGRLARFEPFEAKRANADATVLFENPFAVEPTSIDSDGHIGCAEAMPTAEAVWARARAATITGSALYAGLAVSTFCGAAALLRAEPGARWRALVFATVCAAALGVYAAVPASVLERISLGAPAVGLAVAACVRAQGGTPAMVWAGYGMLLTVAALASAAGLRSAGANRPHQWTTGWTYLQYAMFGALLPTALWVAGGYGQLEIG